MDDYVTAVRKATNFLGVAEMLATIGKENTIHDPYSVMIGKGVIVGEDNIFYPNVIIERTGDGQISIGNNNIFYPGTYLVSSAGSTHIGHSNEFGPAGCVIKANTPDARIVIGDGGRYCDGVSIMGVCHLGSGSQILGSITVQGCTLAAGGTFKESDPDKRAAVLKGFGLARGISLDVGQVINGAGTFAASAVEWQHDYHPKPQAGSNGTR